MLNIKKIRPMFTSLVTTMEKYADDDVVGDTSIIDPTKVKGAIKEYQKVVAVGPMIKGIEVGDLVCIDPSHYAVKKFKPDSIKNDLMENTIQGYNFNIVELNGIPHLLLKDQDIVFVVEEYEDKKWDEALVSSPSLIV